MLSMAKNAWKQEKKNCEKIFKDIGVVDLVEFEGNQSGYNLIISFE